MREDMRYKVIERGRFGDNSNHSSKSRRRTFRGQSDATNKGRMRPDWRDCTGYDRKQLSDTLNPLVRYLRSCVNRQWDAVWSEICADLRAGSTMTQHVRDHITGDIVTLHVVMDGKTPISLPTENGGGGSVVYGLWVHPTNGVLRFNQKPRRYRRAPTQPFATQRGCRIVGDLLLEEVAGVWFMWDLVPVEESPNYRESTLQQTVESKRSWQANVVRGHTSPTSATSRYVSCGRLGMQIATRNDNWSNRPMSEVRFGNLQNEYGRQAVCLNKRQMSKKQKARLLPS